MLAFFGAPGVFAVFGAALAIATIGIFGPRTTNLALETISGLRRRAIVDKAQARRERTTRGGV